MLVAEIIGYLLFLVFIYSIIFFEFFGFQVMLDGSINHPHWLVEWAVFIAVAITMSAALFFLIKRFILVTTRIAKKFNATKAETLF